jgi:ribosome assembly protein 4
VEIPLTINHRQLNSVANGLVQAEERLSNELIPYSFYIDDIEIKESLEKYFLDQTNKQIFEKTLHILCVPKARFQVIPVERCTATIEGHLEAITVLQFSPNGKLLASGSGDTTVRFWDLNTQTPFDEYGQAHRHWILCLSWSPNGKIVASSCKQGLIGLWIGATGKQYGIYSLMKELILIFFLGTKLLSGHRQWINSLSWQPLHLNGSCRLLASGSKDTTIKIWDTHLFKTVFTLSGHTASVTCIKWGGQNLLYSASQDRTIKVWRTTDGILCRTLEGHAHWVNTLALSTDYILRT